MNIRFYLLPIIWTILALPMLVQAKVLIIVENSYFSASTARVMQFSSDVQLYDSKTVEVIPYTVGSGTYAVLCKALWSVLENKYGTCISTSDPVEGAVMIGNLPVPQYYAGSVTEPFDYYYMDIWDSRTNSMYSNHDMTPFNTDAGHAGYFSSKYNVGDGDSKIDIWVSRIYGALIGANQHLRSSAPGGNPLAILTETGIYDEYLDRLHKRYSDPALVPSRGFAMGGLGDAGYPLQSALSMHLLNLPMYVEFNGGASINDGQASAFNFVSQLQAGPRGGTTLGAYNGTVFPNERNARNCTYTQLTDARSYAPYNSRVYSTLDANGWEWAGVFSHSSPYRFVFNFVDNVEYNAQFLSGTQGPFWGNSMRRTGGYIPASGNSTGLYYYYNCNGIATDPFGWGISRDKRAYFQYIVKSTGTYSIYVYYNADTIKNCSNGIVKLVESRLNAAGYPAGGTPEKNYYCPLNMKTYKARDGSTNWECVFYGVTLTANNMASIIIEANEQNGEVIADAVRFVCTSPAIDDKVDNVEPITAAVGSAIFSTQGFFTSDCVDRSFISMQDENDITHDKFSKVPFFITATCGTNNFLFTAGSMDNLGNLLALGHNGLICMATSNGNFPGRGYTPFVSTLASGKSFGQAFTEQVNSSFMVDESNNLINMYALLGAGSLRAQPYIQFGSTIEQNIIVSTAVTNNSTQPVIIRGVTVSGTGIYTVSSTVAPSNPNRTQSEIVIRPETVFQLGSEVMLMAN